MSREAWLSLWYGLRDRVMQGYWNVSAHPNVERLADTIDSVAWEDMKPSPVREEREMELVSLSELIQKYYREGRS